MEQELLERLQGIAEDGFAIGYGFTHAGAPSEHHCTYDPRWQDFYWENGLIQTDPIITFGVNHLGAVRWSDTVHSKNDAVGLARDFNMKDGIVLSVQVDGARAIAGLALPKRPTDVEISEARAILAALQALKAGEQKLQLTNRQREILRLIADGASTAAAAHELQINPNTVNFHKKEALARNKGLVRNLQNLIARASREGAI